uniref:Uncharacterized protein n=1 Tax=viral metagenome TaxID=1070528 RepID=A0A6H1ZKB3_9ZZZZ
MELIQYSTVDIMFVAMHTRELNIHYTDIEKLHIYRDGSNTDRLRFSNMLVDIGSYSIGNQGNDYLVMDDNKQQWTYLFIAAVHSAGNTIGVSRVLDSLMDTRARIRDYILSVESRYEAIKEVLSNARFLLNLPALRKAVNKRKGLMEVINNNIIITFHNIRSGNDIEGYIKYRKIRMVFNGNLTITNIQYHFSKFYYDTDWLYVGCLHPHVMGTSMCWGNRTEDWGLYCKAQAWVFWVDLLRESLSSYNPAGPYRSVTNIRNDISQLQRVLMGNDELLLITEAEAVSRRIFELVSLSQAYCRACNTMLNEDDDCLNIVCSYSPNYEASCSICGGRLVTQGEHTPRTRLQWVCATCYTCPVCNMSSINDHCTDITCVAVQPMTQYEEGSCLHCEYTMLVDGTFELASGLTVVREICDNEDCDYFQAPQCLLCGNAVGRYNSSYASCCNNARCANSNTRIAIRQSHGEWTRI